MKIIKKAIAYITSILAGIICYNFCTAAGINFLQTTNIYNTDREKVINTKFNNNDIEHPLNDGAYWIVKGDNGEQEIGGLISTNTEITDHGDAFNKVLKMIQNIVNYALGIVSLIALIYIIFQGFKILTAGGNDGNKHLKQLKNAIIALVGIGFSRIIISFILWLIKKFAGS